MPACVGIGTVNNNGAQVPVVQPVATPAGTSCPGFVVMSPGEFDQVMAVVQGGPSGGVPSIFSMTVEDGVLVSSSILTLWAIAWAIRATRKALD